LVGFVHFSVVAAVAHQFTALHAQAIAGSLRRYVAKTVRWTSGFTRGDVGDFGAGPATVVAVRSELCRGLSGHDILASPDGAGFGRPAERLLSMLGEQRVCALIYAAAFAFNAVAVLHWLRDSAAGCCVATSAAIVLESVLLFVAARRRLGLHAFVWQPNASGATTGRAGAQPVGRIPKRWRLLDPAFDAPGE